MSTHLLDSSDANDLRLRRFDELLAGASSLEDVTERLEKEEAEKDSWSSAFKKTHPSKILVIIALLFFLVAFGSALSILITGGEMPAPFLASLFIYLFVTMLIFINLSVGVAYLRIRRRKKLGIEQV